jgi:hypothetical protein
LLGCPTLGYPKRPVRGLNPFLTSTMPSPTLAVRERSSHVRVALVLLLLAAVAVPAARAVPPGGPVSTHNGAKVRIDRTAVKAGGRIKVTGSNWKAKGSRVQDGAQVTVKIDDRDILAIFPIRHQRFSGWVRIPKQVKAGRHWLRFLASEPATSVKSKAFRVRT